jgi:hypothetical protein
MSRISRDIEAFFPRPESREGDFGIHPLRWLQRHPVPIVAHFRHSLVLTYALPKELLEPMLPPGLMLDTFNGFGFVAIAMVDTEALRPVFCPKALGQDFFLTGYRIFARYRTNAGRTLRGLRILRSDANRRTMVCMGNRLTHYNYSLAQVNFQVRGGLMEVKMQTPGAAADLHVAARLETQPAPLPQGSPFADMHEARLFAGPLPYTFDYEAETHSIIMIEGVRKEWKPQPVAVEVLRNTFFDQPRFAGCKPVLANAFHVENISYEWRRGIREALPKGAR